MEHFLSADAESSTLWNCTKKCNTKKYIFILKNVRTSVREGECRVHSNIRRRGLCRKVVRSLQAKIPEGCESLESTGIVTSLSHVSLWYEKDITLNKAH